jgi:hypothetical protein
LIPIKNRFTLPRNKIIMSNRNEKEDLNTPSLVVNKKEWAAPVVKLSAVATTKGGDFLSNGSGDDAWYVS